MVAFAANSVLCRMALGEQAIDPAGFTAVRLASGALLLAGIRALAGPASPRRGGDRGRGPWASAAMLFLYAIAFSFAYRSLTTGTGALILFGAVQATMILAALRASERLAPLEWTGLALALGGLVYLVLPGLAAPPPAGCALMALAGIAWGIYSLRGRGSADPLGDTAGNFARSVPLVAVVLVAVVARVHLTPRGVLLAAASGALASGLGYAVWYAALRGLTAARAAVVQLSVPVLAAAGGVAFLGERVTLRLVLAGVFILGGVGLAVAGTRLGIPRTGRVRPG
jgi:drug/metabolite transporter (DMT)-like permease